MLLHHKLFVCIFSILSVPLISANWDELEGDSFDGQEKVELTVFYETLCPYSMKFFTTQLSTLFDNSQLYRYVKFDLIPYGNAKQTHDGDQWKFQCQHGPMECEFNKLHACVTSGISIINSNDVNRVYIPFLICLMKTKNEFSVLQECAERYEVPIDWLRHCQKGKTGTKYLAKSGYKTRRFRPEIKSIPTIVINGKYNQNNQELAESNLVKLVCKNLKSKPSVCYSRRQNSMIVDTLI